MTSTGSPYQPPRFDVESSREDTLRPGVYRWYVGYCIIMALMYLAVVVLGLFILASPEQLSSERNGLPPNVTGLMLVVVGLPLLAVFAIGPFMKRNRAGWIVGIIAIGIGLTSACCLPASVPLLIYWLKPETKDYFGV